MNVHIMPTVEIIMPVFNEALFVESAVRSVERNSSADYVLHLIVVDDHSLDDTYSILEGLSCLQSDRFKYTFIKNESKGKVSAFNTGFKHYHGGCLCLMGGDDIMPDGALGSRLRNYFENEVRSEPCVQSGALLTFSENPDYDGIRIPKSKGRGSESGGAIMMNEPFANKMFPIPDGLPNEDTWLAAGINVFAKKITYSDVVLNYRIHSGNSHKRGVTREEFSAQMWGRAFAYFVFYVNFKGELDPRQERIIVSEIFFELAKKISIGWGVLFLSNVAVRTKARVVLQSTRLGYWVMNKFYRWIVGR